MRELLICPLNTILNCTTAHLGHIFHENNLEKNAILFWIYVKICDEISALVVVKVHFSQFVKCISLRRLLFGVI